MFWRKRKNLVNKRAANKRRKGFMALVFPWLRRFGIALASLTIFAWAGAWFFMSDADTKTSDWVWEKTLDGTVALGFTVDNILVEGRVHTDPDVLKAIINTQKGDPLFGFDPKAAQMQIERITWVDTAHVERRFPGTLYIGLRERKPLALWQNDKKLNLLDQHGAVINAGSLMPFKDLIIVTGEESATEAPALIFNLMAEPEVLKNTESVMWISKRRWDLKLKNGMIVKLPEDDLELALRRLALKQEQDKMMEKDLKIIDLRDQSRIVVQTKPGAVQDHNKAQYKPAKSNAGNNI